MLLFSGDPGATDRPVQIGDRVTIGRWGTRTYRVVNSVQIGDGPRNTWLTLEQLGDSRTAAPRQTVVEQSRLTRVGPIGRDQVQMSVEPPRKCPSCGLSRAPSPTGTCPDCGVPI